MYQFPATLKKGSVVGYVTVGIKIEIIKLNKFGVYNACLIY